MYTFTIPLVNSEHLNSQTSLLRCGYKPNPVSFSLKTAFVTQPGFWKTKELFWFSGHKIAINLSPVGCGGTVSIVGCAHVGSRPRWWHQMIGSGVRCCVANTAGRCRAIHQWKCRGRSASQHATNTTLFLKSWLNFRIQKFIDRLLWMVLPKLWFWSGYLGCRMYRSDLCIQALCTMHSGLCLE